MTIRNIFIIPFLSIGTHLSAQDFIVLDSGDTLYGSIKPKYVHFYDGVVFKRDGRTSEFKPDEVPYFGLRSFTVDGRLFEGRISNHSFVEKFVDGSVSLYKDNSDFFISKDGKIFQLPYGSKEVIHDGIPKEVEVNAWKTILNNLLADCKGEMYRKINRKSQPSSEFLTALVTEYNACQGEGSTIVETSDLLSRFSFTAGAGLGTLDVDKEALQRLTSIDPGDYENSPYFDFGLGYGIPFRMFKKATFVDAAVEVRFSDYNKRQVYSRGSQTTESTFKINRTSLMFPLGFTLALQSPEEGFNVFVHGLGEIRLSERLTSTNKSTNTISGEITITKYNNSNNEAEPAHMGLRTGVMYMKPIGSSTLAGSVFYGSMTSFIVYSPVKFVGFKVHYYFK